MLWKRQFRPRVEKAGLGEIYLRQNRVDDAESLLRRALAIREKKFGPGHGSVADVLNNLATLYTNTNQSRLAEAETLYQRVLAIKEKTLGPDHPALSLVLGNLGQLRVLQNRFADAAVLIKRGLALQEKRSPPPELVRSDLGCPFG